MKRSLRFEWERLASAKWADAWEERLRALIGLDRVAVATKPRSRFLKLAAWNLTKSEANRLVVSFGGTLRAQRTRDWAAETSRPARAPMRVAGRLSVVWDAATQRAEQKRFPDRRVLLIPASAAFGTGEHATTAMSLRLLVGSVPPRPFRLVDAGCGSGILAIAAEKLGAHSRGFDSDPIAVRIARQNAKVNGARRATFRRIDVTEWHPPHASVDVITANLFLELLKTAMPQMATALVRGGSLIASGVLAVQEREFRSSLRRAGLKIEEVRRRGRWIAALARRP